MRRFVVLIISVLVWAPCAAAATSSTHGRFLFIARSQNGFGISAAFGMPDSDRAASDLLLREAPARPSAPEKIAMPRVAVGPFHATLGGVGGGRSVFATEQLDARDFWNSGVSGSFDARGASLTFTLPIQ